VGPNGGAVPHLAAAPAPSRTSMPARGRFLREHRRRANLDPPGPPDRQQPIDAIAVDPSTRRLSNAGTPARGLERARGGARGTRPTPVPAPGPHGPPSTRPPAVCKKNSSERSVQDHRMAAQLETGHPGQTTIASRVAIDPATTSVPLRAERENGLFRAPTPGTCTTGHSLRRRRRVEARRRPPAAGGSTFLSRLQPAHDRAKTIFRSADGGATWATSPRPTALSLTTPAFRPGGMTTPRGEERRPGRPLDGPTTKWARVNALLVGILVGGRRPLCSATACFEECRRAGSWAGASHASRHDGCPGRRQPAGGGVLARSSGTAGPPAQAARSVESDAWRPVLRRPPASSSSTRPAEHRLCR